MSDKGKSSPEQGTIRKTDDGKPLLLRRSELSPLPYEDTAQYLRGPSIEIVLWLINAAGSGIVGNLAYDKLKSIIQDARKRHGRSMKFREQYEREPDEAPDPNTIYMPLPRRIEPDLSLRDDLVELAYDALARYKNLRRGGPDRLISEVDVYFTRSSTWAVFIRELRASRGVTVEINLQENERRNRYYDLEGADGFPVSIWP